MSYYRIRYSGKKTEADSSVHGSYLAHYGISGMRWGMRRFQNEDGTLTEAGKKRYNKYSERADNAASSAKEMSYWRKQTEKAGKRGGEAWRTYSELEKLEANHAIRWQKKANKYAPSEMQRDMQKYLTDNGVSNKYHKYGRNDKISDQEKPQGNKIQNNTPDKNSLENRIKNFDKASTDEKFKIVDDVIKENTRIGREKGYDSPEFKKINDQYWELSRKAGKAKYDDIDRMPKGEKKDAEWEEYLRDPFANGQDSANIEPLLQRMQSRHGDYLSRNFKTEAGRKAAHDLDAASEESIRLDRKIREFQSKRRTKDSDYYENGESIFDKRTKTEAQIQKARDDYAKMVLKDMGMPINKNTIDYIWSIIIWN